MSSKQIDKNMGADTKSQSDKPWFNIVRQKVESLRFGVVQITVHDGQVMQIERTEKIRMDRFESGSTASTKADSDS